MMAYQTTGLPVHKPRLFGRVKRKSTLFLNATHLHVTD